MSIHFGAKIVGKHAALIQRNMEKTSTGRRALHETSDQIVIEESSYFPERWAGSQRESVFVRMSVPSATGPLEKKWKEALLEQGRLGVKQLDPLRYNPIVDESGIGSHGFEGQNAHSHLKFLDFCNQIFALDDVLRQVRLSAFQTAVGDAFAKNKQTPDPAFNAIKGAFFQTIGTITEGTATGAALDTEIKGAIRQFYIQLVSQGFVSVEGDAQLVIEAATEAKLAETRQQVLDKRPAPPAFV